MKIYYDRDADLQRLQGKKVAVIGYGSQGHAHAQNLRDSGLDVVVGLHEGSRSRDKARADGLRVESVADAAKQADVIMVVIPDQTQHDVYEASIKDNLEPGNMLMFAHGFSIHFGEVVPPPGVDVTMIAPKSPGHRLRELYTEGVGVPALIAVHQDATGKAMEVGLSYCSAIGGGRSGIIETNFRQECETDLFGEQAVLCGGLVELIRAGFETLVEAGYAPEMAYFECLHEVKLIVDLICEGGLANMRYSISNTAEFGDYTRGPRVIDDHARAEMKRILAEIQSGAFAREWVLENHAGQVGFKAMRRRAAAHPVEQVGERLRAMMPWIGEAKLVDRERS